MTTIFASLRPWNSLVAALGVAGCIALVPLLAEAAKNPVATPNVIVDRELAVATPGEQTYVLKFGKQIKQVSAKTITITRAGDGTVTGVWADGAKLKFAGVVSVSIATGTGANSGGTQASYSQTTTTTQLPGGGTRTDIDHGNGSSTTIIHDPAGGKNGGSRTTTSTTDSEGNTTTTTTTTDGSDGSTTTTTTTSP